jgi:hypothetical protein
MTRGGPWFGCLPGCETRVPCGAGVHAVRWEAGSLRLPEHPDPEGELVLAALGGEKAHCVELAEAWARHTEDLSVLAIGPRSAADEITVSWDDVAEAASLRGTAAGPGRRARPGAMRQILQPPGQTPAPPVPRTVPATMAAAQTARQRSVLAEQQRLLERRNDLLSLLALGYGFQVRLAGQVAAAHASRLDDEAGRARPALTAAMTGRLALIAEAWLGIDPGQLVVSLHGGPGWGTVELTGSGARHRLRAALPATWLAWVWACGLALVGRHLVVGVLRPGWPDARVLGLRAPGAEPVPLDVRAVTDSSGDGGQGVGQGAHRELGNGAGHGPHWELSVQREV